MWGMDCSDRAMGTTASVTGRRATRVGIRRGPVVADGSSINDIFRFVQLRPQRATRQIGVVALARDTPLVKDLTVETTSAARTARANEALAQGAVRSIDDVALGAETVSALVGLRVSADSTVQDLRDALPALARLRRTRDFASRRSALSDSLVASYFATEGIPADVDDLTDVYRVYNMSDDDEGPLARWLARPLMAPTVPPTEAPRRTVGGFEQPAAPEHEPAGPDRDDKAEQLPASVEELVALDRPAMLVQPDSNGTTPRDAVPFSLTASARKLVSARTDAILAERGIDLAAVPLDVAITRLDTERSVVRPIAWPRPAIDTQSGVTLPPPPAHALVRPAGVADLLVVKQQIKRYEAGEIAHVENVLIGEKKSRAHRELERSEETTLTETENTRVRENELQTADRFELNRETSQTIKADQKTGFGLSVSGKYGPAVEFTSKAETSASTAQEESSKNSSTYARDVVSRSLERVTERVREVRTRTLIRETEETNLHELDNTTTEHVRGIYQFLDKIYETQVFNYGIRQMFDFMVPEPASFLWYIAANPTLDVDLPPEPEKLDTVAADASYVNEDNALALAAAYGATDVDLPPPLYKLLAVGARHGEDDADETGQPHSSQRIDLAVPAGYRLLRATVRGLAFTDENPVIAVAIGSRRAVWKPASADRVSLSAGRKLVHQPSIAMNLDVDPYELAGDAKFGVSVLAWETNTYSLEVVVVVKRMPAELDRWRVATYKKIRDAYQDRVKEWEQRVEELRSEAEARAEKANELPFGAPPAANQQTITTELKKQCLSIITQQRYDAFDATKDDKPPFFDFTEAAAEGSYIRFFEQAFEWDQMQYVFYPYFWSRKTTWVDRFVKQDVDPEFLDFLRAGAARVVVPVRPGFEVAITHFIETGKIWAGQSDPPPINSALYVSIIDEIRERTGAPQGEIPVGEPWDARLPTSLVLVRADSDLPRWERLSSDGWEWQPGENS
jgi:hypothetical protein